MFYPGCKKKFLLHQKCFYLTEINQIVRLAFFMAKNMVICIENPICDRLGFGSGIRGGVKERKFLSHFFKLF